MSKHKFKRQPMEQRTCKQCGAAFSVAPNQIRNGGGTYCSRKCMGKAQTSRMPVYTCQCCGKVFSARKTKPERKYCSRACAAKSTRGKEGKRGDGRTHEHEKWRLAIILRDKKCVRCDALENLQAHHLKSWKHHPELRYDMENGVALCPLCHITHSTRTCLWSDSWRQQGKRLSIAWFARRRLWSRERASEHAVRNADGSSRSKWLRQCGGDRHDAYCSQTCEGLP